MPERLLKYRTASFIGFVGIFLFADAFAFLEDGVTAFRMDRTINPRSAQQRFVRSVHDRVDFLFGYVTEGNYDLTNRFANFVFVHR